MRTGQFAFEIYWPLSNLNVKSTVKILSIFVVSLENLNFTIFILSNIVIFKSFREYGRRLYSTKVSIFLLFKQLNVFLYMYICVVGVFHISTNFSFRISTSDAYALANKINSGWVISLFKNPSIYNIIRWVAWTMGQTNHRPSIWCSKYYYFFHDSFQNSLQKSFQFIFLYLLSNYKNENKKFWVS